MKHNLIKNKQKHKPIKVMQSDDTGFKSVSTGKLLIVTKQTKQVKQAHDFDKLQINLISICQLYDIGHTTYFNKCKCDMNMNIKK